MSKVKNGLLVLLSIVLSFLLLEFTAEAADNEEKTPSQLYVEAMGSGWNLGNTFDGFDAGGDQGEESWGNPRVTRELIRTIKDRGFDSIRIPFTTTMRIGDESTNYLIDEVFLNRYEEVVNWALEEDLYVMVNVHHDSWEWLANWDGDPNSSEFQKFESIWIQLAERFKDYDERLMFESINEPQFWQTDEAAALFAINEVFYTIVREFGGNNLSRMLILPTIHTDFSQDKLDALYQQITNFEDENIIATIHYYSEWVYSANLGKTRFDEVLWDNQTPRTSLVEAFDRVYDTYTANGIGVTVGEYGLLGYDKSDYANNLGETLKFIEFINYYADQKDINLMLWDNGQHLNRWTYEWNNPLFGAMIKNSMSTRSSYAAGLDTIFISDEELDRPISIPLILNGNELTAIYNGQEQLIEEQDYTYESETITLTQSYIQGLAFENYGEMTNLIFLFSNGADWRQTLVYSDTPYLHHSEGTVAEGLFIETDFNGTLLEKAESVNEEGEIVSNNSWWGFLEYHSEFRADYENETIVLTPTYFNAADNGSYILTFTFYDGSTIEYSITVDGNSVIGYQLTEVESEIPDDDDTDNGDTDTGDEDNENSDDGNVDNEELEDDNSDSKNIEDEDLEDDNSDLENEEDEASNGGLDEPITNNDEEVLEENDIPILEELAKKNTIVKEDETIPLSENELNKSGLLPQTGQKRQLSTLLIGSFLLVSGILLLLNRSKLKTFLSNSYLRK